MIFRGLDQVMFPCPRCGQPQRVVEVTKCGDKERSFVLGMPCDCPGPRCFACGTRVDERGRCPSIDCYMLDNIVPIPDVW
jgi:hypothetical protein